LKRDVTHIMVANVDSFCLNSQMSANDIVTLQQWHGYG